MPKRMENLENLLTTILQQNYENTKSLDMQKCGFRIYSQNDEDGILIYIFSKIGTTNKRFVEFGIGNGIEYNTANLSINLGWSGLLMDGDADGVKLAQNYYKRRLGLDFARIQIAQHMLTAENINCVLLNHKVKDEIDLIIIDIDGIEYYVWEAVNVINPRVVVIEYNLYLGYKNALTVKYDPEFNRFKEHSSGMYFGASLPALVKLARSKGYVLVHVNGINAFFVRKDIARDKLREISVSEASQLGIHNISQLGIRNTPEAFERIQHLNFVYV
jgi:hypothetical protein